MPASFGETRGGTDADRHHHHVAFNDAAVFQLDAFNLLRAENAFGIGLGDDVDAALVQRLFQKIGRCRIELPLHDRRHQMDDGDVHSPALQPISCFQTQKAGADDDGATLAFGDFKHLRDIVEIAIGENARQLMAVDGMMKGREPVAITSLS